MRIYRRITVGGPRRSPGNIRHRAVQAIENLPVLRIGQSVSRVPPQSDRGLLASPFPRQAGGRDQRKSPLRERIAVREKGKVDALPSDIPRARAQRSGDRDRRRFVDTSRTRCGVRGKASSPRAMGANPTAKPNTSASASTSRPARGLTYAKGALHDFLPPMGRQAGSDRRER
jgi:hypothetical protein